MSLFDSIPRADVGADILRELRRIVDALDRLTPPLPADDSDEEDLVVDDPSDIYRVERDESDQSEAEWNATRDSRIIESDEESY